MATFTVWRSEESDGAERVLHVLERLQKEQLIQIHDAAVVTWPEGARKPKTKQMQSMTGAGALGGAFWGMLFGLIFFVPLLGIAVGAAAGALAGSLSDVGIDDGFIERVRDEVTPGTSALFLLSSDAVEDKVREAVLAEAGPMELIHTNLTMDQEARLRDAFSEDEVASAQ
jgi:uncharacterized membrane protein